MVDGVKQDEHRSPEIVIGETAPVTMELGVVPEPLDSAAWPAKTVKSGLHMRVPTAVLLALLVAGGAFWGGVALEKGHAGTTTGAGGFAARFGRGTGATSGSGTGSTTGRAGGFAGFGGASTAAATGTVTVVVGDTLYVTSATGSIVKVDLAPTTKVTRNASATVAALKPGDTVVVQGSKASDGTVSATSVAATAAGVTTASAFAGFGAGTGGSGTTSRG